MMRELVGINGNIGAGKLFFWCPRLFLVVTDTDYGYEDAGHRGGGFTQSVGVPVGSIIFYMHSLS